jgi:AtzE family amidohydrolase
MSATMPAPASGASIGDALTLAGQIRAGTLTATALIEQTLAGIAARGHLGNAFTLVTAERARAQARAIDAQRAAGQPLAPLAGVPFAVKNLFDIAGEITMAGSKVNATLPPATQDAFLVKRLSEAGAILVGALNMDEFAYGFTTENSHVGPCRNPHDRSRLAGGSSGGSAVAVADGLVPLTLGSDTNGSIRVPASLCGVFGLKPTYGRLSRHGSFPFVASLDHVGPFASTLADLALCYDLLQSPDPADPACAQRPLEPVSDALAEGAGGLRIARLEGHFERYAGPVARASLERACAALGVSRRAEWPLASEGRAAAFVITSSEGGALHLAGLRERYADYEPLSRDRFIAGSLMPAAWYNRAQRVRARYARAVAERFADVDVFLAPVTPVPAPPIGSETVDINGMTLPARASMGILTQPVSCIGLPVLAAPVPVEGELPMSIQIIAAPWRERDAFRVAAELVRAGVCRVPVPPPSA